MEGSSRKETKVTRKMFLENQKINITWVLPVYVNERNKHKEEERHAE